LAEYRHGQFRAAGGLMKEVLTVRTDPNRTVAAFMVLAMAQHQMNQSAEAQSTFSEGSKLADIAIRRADGGQWNDQTSARIFLREARELIESNNPSQNSK